MRLPISFRRPSNVNLAVWVTFFTALYFYLPVMTLYLLRLGLNLLQISAMSGIIIAAQFAAELPTGVLADRWGRKTAWVLSVFCQFLGELWFFFARSYWEFVCISVIAGIGFAFASGAIDALIYDTLPESDREQGMKQAMGKISAAGRIGNLAAFLASGVILSQLTPQRFALGIGLTVVSVGIGVLLTLLVFEPKTAPPVGPQPSSVSIFKSGLALLRANPNLRRIVLLMILSDPFAFYLLSLDQPYFLRSGVPSGWFGPVVAVASLLAAASERYSYKMEAFLGMRWGMLLSTALPGIIYLLMSPVRQPGLAVAMFLLLYASLFAARPLLRAYVNGHIASHNRATVLSMIQLLASIYLSLMGLLLGFIGDRSITALFAFMGIVVLLAAVMFRIDERHR